MKISAILGLLAATAPLAGAFVPSARTFSARPLVLPTTTSSPPRTTTATTHTTRLLETAAAAEEPRKTGGGTATVPELTFNLVKGIVGAGVLGLPAGICAFGNAPSAAIPALVLIGIIGMLSAYGFGLIGRVCSFTDTTSFKDAWAESVSPETSWMPAVAVTFKTICALLAYSMILGDTFSSLFAGAGYTVSSTTSLLGITGLVLLPLCLLKNLSSLAPVSLLGSAGMVYTAIAMAIRYFGKAYAKGGKFHKAVPVNLQPSFGTVGAKGVLSPNAAILVAMLSTAFMAHFNAPKFFTELKDNTIPRFSALVATSFAIAIALFASMTCLGFLTFGSACSGVILNNYATTDTLMGISRIAVAVSLVGSFPLAFVGARDGVMDLFNIKNRSNKNLNSITLALLAGVTGLALVIPDVTFVLSFAGATLGNALIYVFPGIMFRGAVKRMKDASAPLKGEVKLAMANAALGVVLGGLGAFMAVKSLAG
ncbi:Sodium-coupled neutral amino acid transporter 3 [Seminavis robusta]|uniref:Sodium-coupled neutral amino acid transporter 3 n=1 Tax=Seminavis robusta TaxID=568900 RepID=A0A9N8EA74_9STRA|nr:Sodium-coupled neutral amino acid transporter 3 [Seminavis robusta]|eukprot:Sro719_g192340.1 Sodium-coupled neutral amino acid transporter 3 (482) ;mRNA; r:28118-29695